MQRLPFALGAAALLVLACDPTQKKDFHCTANFQTVEACTQFHITDAEGLVADPVCADKNGQWRSGACPTDEGGATRVAGYCLIDASGYTLSGTDAKVFFYDPPVSAAAAEAACSGNGTWVP